jgi:hypothetical protein
MKNSISWGSTPCTLKKFNGCFGGNGLHLQDRKTSQDGDPHEAGGLLHPSLLLVFTFPQ